MNIGVKSLIANNDRQLPIHLSRPTSTPKSVSSMAPAAASRKTASTTRKTQTIRYMIRESPSGAPKASLSAG